MPNPLVIRDQIHGALYHALHDGEHSLKVVPGLIKRALAEEVWKDRIVHQYGKPIPAFCSFRAYVEAKPPDGLGATIELIEGMIRDDTRTLRAFRRATVGKHGGDRRSKSDNVTLEPRRGNSRAYTLDRLARERPDLSALVDRGKMSAHAAAVKAGFHKRATPLEQALRLLPKLTRTELHHLLARINQALKKERAA